MINQREEGPVDLLPRGTQSTSGRKAMQPWGLDGRVHAAPLSFHAMNV